MLIQSNAVLLFLLICQVLMLDWAYRGAHHALKRRMGSRRIMLEAQQPPWLNVLKTQALPTAAGREDTQLPHRRHSHSAPLLFMPAV